MQGCGVPVDLDRPDADASGRCGARFDRIESAGQPRVASLRSIVRGDQQPAGADVALGHPLAVACASSQAVALFRTDVEARTIHRPSWSGATTTSIVTSRLIAA
jgi:hypothetical protein